MLPPVLLEPLQPLPRRLTSEQLSTLPKGTITLFLKFQSLLADTSYHVDRWIEFSEGGDLDWLTAEVVHKQWLSLLRLVESARGVLAAMIAVRVVSQAEANALYKGQVAWVAGLAFSSTLNETKIKAAVGSISGSEVGENT